MEKIRLALISKTPVKNPPAKFIYLGQEARYNSQGNLHMITIKQNKNHMWLIGQISMEHLSCPFLHHPEIKRKYL